jgi:hypothetical protein
VSEPSQVIATRVFELADGGSVVLELYAPEPDPAPNGDFRCGFRIVGLCGSDGVLKHIYGVDAVQALVLALQTIGVFLYTSAEGRAGDLTWLGGRDLGLPLSEANRDLAPRSGPPAPPS